MFSDDDFTNRDRVLESREQLSTEGMEPRENEPTLTSAQELMVPWRAAAMGVSVVVLTISAGPALGSDAIAFSFQGGESPPSDSVRSEKQADWKTRRLELIDKKYESGLSEDESSELAALNERIDREISDEYHGANERLDKLEKMVFGADDADEP